MATKASEFQNLTRDELLEKEGQFKKQLMQLRFDAKLGKLEKHSTIKEKRRDIARILTVMNQQKAAGKNVQSEAVASTVKAKVPSESTAKNAVGAKAQTTNVKSAAGSKAQGENKKRSAS